ncbi:hypothetical protein N7462_010107 [Penicillium macrosclerotiorum]|uniref:uncharacterized protein n=1 Tax=Penicillium macrosclerotiorum TaxID=303699 RepID=UPI002548C962|nr:uncharacterized protein N7462_010107 [Penicillium macrosclerotiorum]KAJ5669037.1 hypothetical protein N7462_010107 [Penicillium macrosclerotiorum]
MAGVSLGGHTAWRIASLASPGQFHAYAMIVGCPKLSSLLLDRLKRNSTESEKQQSRWPQALSEIVDRDDREVANYFPNNVPLLLCNGAYDRLVPAKYTAEWIEERRSKGCEQDITFYVQENTGHSCTKEMVAMMAVWLRDILPAPSSHPVL